MSNSSWLRCACGLEFSSSTELMKHKCLDTWLPLKPVLQEAEEKYGNSFRDKVILAIVSNCIDSTQLSEIICNNASSKAAASIVGLATAITNARYDKAIK